MLRKTAINDYITRDERLKKDWKIKFFRLYIKFFDLQNYSEKDQKIYYPIFLITMFGILFYLIYLVFTF